MDIIGEYSHNCTVSLELETQKDCSICEQFENSSVNQPIGNVFSMGSKRPKKTVVALIGDPSLVKSFVAKLVMKHDYDLSTSMLRYDIPSTIDFRSGKQVLKIKVIPPGALHDEQVFDDVDSVLLFYNGSSWESIRQATHAFAHFKNEARPAALNDVVSVEVDTEEPSAESLTEINSFLLNVKPKARYIMSEEMRFLDAPILEAVRLTS